MYFSGGPKSFAAQFHCHFPMFEERDGTTSYEVPIPMLALAATAVSQTFLRLHLSIMITIIALHHHLQVAFQLLQFNSLHCSSVSGHISVSSRFNQRH